MRQELMTGLNGRSAMALIALLLLMGSEVRGQRQDLRLVVQGTSSGVPFHHFWRSTGFCPPKPHEAAADFDLSADMRQNLAYIGAVPHSGIQQVRVHWLLDLVKVNSLSSGKPDYNFTALDQFIALLHSNGLRPGFEIMGNPALPAADVGIFTDLENKTQVYWWRDLVQQTAQRYINEYGLNFVKSWNFETWNEPDCHDFDGNKMTVQGFLNYYDACSEGLKAASPLLVFGGPGDGCFTHGTPNVYSFALYDHVVNGINYFTGEKGVRLDFISLHRKADVDAMSIMKEEISSLSAVFDQYPQLTHTPFYNDEADPLVGWSKDELWRSSAVYAAMAVKVIGQHQNMMIAPGSTFINYTLLSNDNGFLSYYPHQFTQRTLLARFQMNFTSSHSRRNNSETSRKSLTESSKLTGHGDEGKENYVTFVRKPIYAAMVLLSKLGESQIFTELTDELDGTVLPNSSYAAAMGTMHVPQTDSSSDSKQWAVVVYSSFDTHSPPLSGQLDFIWTIESINATDLMLAVYMVSEQTTSPYTFWHDACRKPDFPSLEQFAIIRRQEGPYLYNVTSASSDSYGRVQIPPMELIDPSVILLHLCQRSKVSPEQVVAVQILNITAGQVIIRWSDANIKTKCIKTYEVEKSSAATKGYQRINPEDTIVNLFVYSTDAETKVQGSYRVRAVDYWGRPGQYSQSVLYS